MIINNTLWKMNEENKFSQLLSSMMTCGFALFLIWALSIGFGLMALAIYLRM